MDWGIRQKSMIKPGAQLTREGSEARMANFRFAQIFQTARVAGNVSAVLRQKSSVLIAEMSIHSPETWSAAIRSRDHLWGAFTLAQDPLCASQAAANIRGSCGCECTVYLGRRSLFSGVKGHPYADVLKIYGQMGPLRSKPPALFGLSRWWNIDGKIEIFCLLLSVARLKGLMCVKTFPVSSYNQNAAAQRAPTSTGAESKGSVGRTRIDKLCRWI